MKSMTSRFLLAVTFAAFGASLSGATITVTSAEDNFAEPPAGSLRAAIAAAADGDTIVISESLNGQTIQLQTVPTVHGDASLAIADKSLIIEGPSQGITIDGGWDETNSSDTGTRLFYITGAATTNVFKHIKFYRGHGRVWNSYSGNYQAGAIFTYGAVQLENCEFLRNAHSYNQQKVFIRPGGGAIYAENGVVAYNTSFVSNEVSRADMQYGIIVCTGGESVFSNCVFRSNYCASYGAAITLHSGSLNIYDSKFEDNRTNHSGADIFVLSTAIGSMFIKNTVFRNGYCGDGNGGSICMDGNGHIDRLVLVNCEFSNCSCPGCGGAIRVADGGNTDFVAVNSTFANSAANSWGSAIDIRGKGYLVNCTITGSMDNGKEAANSNGSVLFFKDDNAFLNSVEITNILKPKDESCRSNRGAARYGYGTLNVINSIANEKRVDRTTSLDLENDLIFAEPFVSTNCTSYVGGTMVLYRDFDFPVLEVDPKNLHRSHVVEIARGGLLDGTGYPIKANADYSYIAYSTDNRETWTTLFGEVDGSAVEITSDQRGIPYYRGKTPIGAATYVSDNKGLVILVR